jgi:hypothetical protein
MPRGLIVSILAGVGLAVSTSAAAQSTGRVGLVMGYPTSVGVSWQVADGVALRPDVTLNWTTTETTSTATLGGSSTVTTRSEGWTTGLGLSALFYLGASNNDLRFYIVPRAAYLWSSTDIENTPDLPQLGPYESDGTGLQASGAFGAQYSVNQRFRLFGELGVGYTTQETETGYTLSRSAQETSTFGLRSGVGVVVVF